MKKIIVVMFFVMLISLSIKKENVIIPKESIRFRVIANSNSSIDQELKMQVKSAIEPKLMSTIINSKNIANARENIKSFVPEAHKIVNKYTDNYEINYGKNYFPEKEYKGVTYKEGEYESLVITLGDGLGKNWWCVLFPPLCLIEADENNVSDIDYQLYIKKIIDKF